MTTFIKAKLKIQNDKTNIDKYRVATNITEYHIIQYSKMHDDTLFTFYLVSGNLKQSLKSKQQL